MIAMTTEKRRCQLCKDFLQPLIAFPAIIISSDIPKQNDNIFLLQIFVYAESHKRIC